MDHKLVTISIFFGLCKISGKICQKIKKKFRKGFLENNFGFFFILLGRTWSNAFRFESDLIRPMNSGDALHCSLCSTVHFAEQWRRGNAVEEEEEGEGEGEGKEQTTLRGGDVWLAVETAEAGGELKELLGRWRTILLIFPLFL